MLNRRNFIRHSAIAGAGVMISGGLISACSADKKTQNQTSDHLPFGIQLWSVKDEMAKNSAQTLKSLSSFGYQQIESFEGDQGMLWGMSPTAFTSLMSDLGMRLVASHCDVFKDLEAKATMAAEAGVEYLICPFLGANGEIDFYKEAADQFSTMAEICKKAGVGFAYHNHDYSFRKVENEYPQKILMEYSSDDVFFELDLYWVAAAGEDPVAWFRNYKEKCKLIHIKDRENLPVDVTDASTQLGNGTLDFAAFAEAYKNSEIDYVIVEQERYEDSTPMEAARNNAGYMKNLLKI